MRPSYNKEKAQRRGLPPEVYLKSSNTVDSQRARKKTRGGKPKLTSRYALFDRAAHAATSAATETLYGCFARHKYFTRLRGKAPNPTRRPAKPAFKRLCFSSGAVVIEETDESAVKRCGNRAVTEHEILQKNIPKL
jgi:hypothetical protein